MIHSTIAVNALLQWVDESEPDKARIMRVLWLDVTDNVIVLINIMDQKALPEIHDMTEIMIALDKEEVVKKPLDPYSVLLCASDAVITKHTEYRNRAWDIIEDLVQYEPEIYSSNGRGTLVHNAAEQHDVHPMTIYKYLRRYWIGGKTKNALLPAYSQCGAPGKKRIVDEHSGKRGRPSKLSHQKGETIGVNVTEDIKQIFRVATRLYYDTNRKAPLKYAYDQMIRKYFNQGYRVKDGVSVPILPPISEMPTFGQYKYWYYQESDLKNSLMKREGERNYNLNHRPVLGNSSQMAVGPGSVFQFDATIADVYLVSSYDRTLIIGRPIVYIVIDAFSRMIVGIYVGLEGPSWLGAMMALANATIPKVDFCALYGITITQNEWPCSFLPDRILADRGEMAGYNADNLSNSLNIRVSNTPPYRADWKGIVEQYFRIANVRAIHWLPGAVRKRLRERGEKDHRLDATMTIEEFTKVMLHMVLQHNQDHWMQWYSRDEFMITDHIDPIPSHLWDWGIRHRSGHLREMDPSIIRLNLMPRSEARITHKGIKWEGCITHAKGLFLSNGLKKRAEKHGQCRLLMILEM